MALVSRAVGRDPSAFGALYERFVAPIYQYLYYRTGDRATAEDLTEEVFLRAWQAIGGFRWQGRPFVAWLYRLAHNVHVDLVRRARTMRPLESGRQEPDTADQTAPLAFERALDQDLLARAICQLSPDQQQVIVLRFAQGLDTPTIAAQMGREEGAVRALQMRALRRLRQLLSAEGDGASDA
jgi:RNA polymerase sigma-70 factor (ECF subfamily)